MVAKAVKNRAPSYLYHILCPIVGPLCDRDLCSGSGAKFCTDRSVRRSCACVSAGGFDSASGGLAGDVVAILDVAKDASESCDVVPAELTWGCCGTIVGGAVGTFVSGRGSPFAFASASCTLAAGVRSGGDVVGSSEFCDDVSVRTTNSTLCGAVSAAGAFDGFAVNASVFAGEGILGDDLKMSQLGTMRPTAIAPAPTATPPTAATNPNKRNTFDCFVSEDPDCCDFIITSPTCGSTDG
jgi:hypothetical protein